MTKHVSLLIFLIGLGILLGYVGAVQADVSEFRVVVSRNGNTVGSRLHMDLEMRIASGSTSPRTLNSLTIDVSYGAELTAFTSNPDSNWFTNTTGYDLSVSKLTSPVNYYRVLVTGNGIGKTSPGVPAGFSVTSTWQRVVTLRWTIATVSPSYTVTLLNTTDCAAYFDNPLNNPTADITEWATAVKSPAALRVAVKMFLNGPYDTSADQMTVALNPTYLPLTSPYAWDARTVAAIPATVTDWVCLQLRDRTNGEVLSAKSAFLRRDGFVVADNGTTQELTMSSPSGEGDYYIVVRHRNHLAAMSTATPLAAGSVSTYDFSTAQAKFYNNGGKLLETGVYGMYAGDGNQDNYINAIDKNIVWRVENGTFGYLAGDFDLTGFVNAIDKNLFWRLNNGTIGQVP